jgi:polyphosphate kinase
MAKAPAAASATLLNRELSWLDFNARVLELAADESMPLLERVKFCSIFSSNLDEFFMVRVAGLMDQAASGLPVRSHDGITPREALAAIRERVEELMSEQARLWRKVISPLLAAEGINVGRVEDCLEDERAELRRHFERQIFPVLTPLGVGPGQPFPYISGLSLSLSVLARDPETGEERFARVKVPEQLPRFVEIGGGRLLLPLEDVIGHYLDGLFPGMEIVERSFFRVTRDADMELSDDADDLLEAVQAEIRRRRFGDVVRVEVASSMSARMAEQLRTGLRVTDAEIYPIKGMLDLSELMQIVQLDRPELKDEAWRPITQARLHAAHGQADVFAEISRSDVFVHHPYESFASSVERFIDAASTDLAVRALKTTVYRTSEESPIVPALVRAAEAGKQSVCLVELKARFDERRNIEQGRALEQAGVHVAYGFPDLKIHAKTTLVVRLEGDHLRRYVHIGTGNYHSVTARLYEDVGIFTADEDIGADVADLFNYLTGFGRPQKYRKLLVAPAALRSRLVALIRQVASAAAEGKRAEIRLKVNALTDPGVIDELIAAAEAGAKIEIVARSICMLCPVNERITVRSVLGRFLEHSRILVFHAGDESHYLIGSADLMPRNLDHRIEIVVPVESPRAQAELNTILDTLWQDNRQAWQLDSTGRWTRLQPADGEKPKVAQTVLMRRAQLRERRQIEYRNRGR